MALGVFMWLDFVIFKRSIEVRRFLGCQIDYAFSFAPLLLLFVHMIF